MVLTKTYWKSKSFSQRFAERKSATGAVKNPHNQPTSGNPIQAYVSSLRPKQQKLRAGGENVGPGKDFIALAW